MTIIYLILYLLAAVCFALAARGYRGNNPYTYFVAAGLFCWVLVPLIQTAAALAD